MSFRKIISLLLLLCLSFSFVACNKECDSHVDDDLDGICDVCDADMPLNGDGNNNVGNTDGEHAISPSEFSVKVVTEAGAPVSGVQVYVHKSDKEFDVVSLPKTTDESGVAEFSLSDGFVYSVQLTGVNERYTVPTGDYAHGRYAVKGAELVITLSYNPDYRPSVYQLGDKVADFTVTDIDGNSYSLYELLESKDMVMLNFWFGNCSPCRSEFPAINSAYGAYSDKVEILAINDQDSANSVKGFEAQWGLQVDFPLIADKTSLHPTSFNNSLYPTTVIIDRYGVVCLVEVYAVPQESYWRNLFEYFTGDEYTQRLFSSILDVPKTN